MHPPRSSDGILRTMQRGYIAIRGPEYIQINIQCCIREIRKMMLRLSRDRSLSVCPDIERRIDELCKLVAMLHESAAAQRVAKQTGNEQSSHLNFHRKAGLYHKAQKRLYEQYVCALGVGGT